MEGTGLYYVVVSKGIFVTHFPPIVGQALAVDRETVFGCYFALCTLDRVRAVYSERYGFT